MSRDDYSYYRRRMVQEEAASRNAAGPQARERHLELAAAYQLRCKLLEELIGAGAGWRVATMSVGATFPRPADVPPREAHRVS